MSAKTWRHCHKGVWGTAEECPAGVWWKADPFTVGTLRTALEGLPDDMPVVAPAGCEGGDEPVELVKVVRAKRVEGATSCEASIAVEDVFEPGLFEEACCGRPGSGPVFEVVRIADTFGELIEERKQEEDTE